MGDIVNLRRARKAKRREAEAAQADANRRRHGQTSAERGAAEQRRAATERTLDNARIEREPT